MISKTHSFRDPRNPIGVLILLAAFAAAAGCSTANTTGGGGDVVVNHVSTSGNSVPGWVTPTGGSHANSATMNYIANGGSSSCTECHGSDLAGGISRVSCFGNTAGCHHGPVPNWITAAVHGVTAKKAPGSSGFASCQICHGTGTNFSGGSSGVSCYTCHLPTANSPHASQWRTGDAYVHTTTDTGNAAACAYCHLNGANSPIAAPSPPAPAGTAPGCFNSTLCHGSTGAAHPVPFNESTHFNVVTATFTGECGACHDVSAPTVKPGPVCQTCHVAASPLAAANCTSCHASPPNGGAGAAYANIAGAHAAHIALNGAGTPISCNTCHNGLGSGTLAHYNRAESRTAPGDAAFPATYAAQSGASAFDNSAALSCSNVSCHGGQATPNWRTGAIDVNTQCTSCHTTVTTTQFNGPASANHNRSQHQVPCTVCHSTTTLAANHFTNLATPAREGPASATIGGIAITSYVPATRSCTPACHGNETW